MKTNAFTLVLSLTTLLAAASGVLAGDWPHYRGPHGDGISDETIAVKWPAEGPKQLWKVPTPTGFSSFVAAGGRVFTIVKRDIDGAPREVCLALDGLSGKELWAMATGVAKYQGGGDSGEEGNRGGDGPRTTPAATATRVFVYSSDMVLQGLDAATGKEVWHKDVPAEFGGKNIGWKSAASPVLDGDLVYVAGGGPGQSLLAFRQDSGAVAWKAGSEALTHATPVVATLHGVRQVIFLAQSGLVAVEAASGKPLWKFAFPYRTSTACSPVISGNIIFCTAGYEIGGAACEVAKTADGFEAKELWRVKGNNDVASLWSTPVCKDGYLYGMLTFKRFGNGPLKCVDIKTGAIKWQQPGFGTGQVILVGGRLVALADNGQVTLIDPSPDGYKELGKFKAVEGKCWSTPAFSQGRLLVRSTKEGAAFELTMP